MTHFVSGSISMGSTAPRLVIGAVQFGMTYGVTNTRGQVPLREVAAILHRAYGAGIRFVDTAAGYGTSEAVLGGVLPDFPAIDVITKLPAFPGVAITEADIKEMRDAVLRSLDLLHRSKLYGLLVHHSGDLSKPGGERIVELLDRLKQDGIAERIGVSVYDIEDIDRILKNFRPDIAQMPINLFDQRFVQGGHVERLHKVGAEVHARSIFLQGVLLMEAARLPRHFGFFAKQFAHYESFLNELGITRLAACLSFVMNQSGADYALIGVTSVDELDQILAALSQSVPLSMTSQLASSEHELIDPRQWPLAP